MDLQMQGDTCGWIGVTRVKWVTLVGATESPTFGSPKQGKTCQLAPAKHDVRPII